MRRRMRRVLNRAALLLGVLTVSTVTVSLVVHADRDPVMYIQFTEPGVAATPDAPAD